MIPLLDDGSGVSVTVALQPDNETGSRAEYVTERPASAWCLSTLSALDVELLLADVADETGSQLPKSDTVNIFNPPYNNYI